ncbi:TMEM175 family protein [Dinghuibacter silviterrae]|uniref:Putative membrane protein n=1 Tax=Dinghuibacter silviterrae TaxID=1539049 RepID=A0A4R8DGQ3_9BACT|nr:TMEM175 family protein [Dinghuibacter silviterrae]TDW96140.1 putative membrane protein [Dinghuibacter silviterrae]
MKKGRLEAFSDGVFAIIITIMVLELHVPHGDQLKDLMGAAPLFIGYVLSFVYVGIYWNNHHHMFYVVDKIDGGVLWANLNLLFWLSLVPFVTEWMGGSHFSRGPVALYGFILIMAGLAYNILSRMLIRCAGHNTTLAEAIGNDRKGTLSVVVYACAIGISFVSPIAALCLYWVVAVVWFIPDPRIEKRVGRAKND